MKVTIESLVEIYIRNFTFLKNILPEEMSNRHGTFYTPYMKILPGIALNPSLILIRMCKSLLKFPRIEFSCRILAVNLNLYLELL